MRKLKKSRSGLKKGLQINPHTPFLPGTLHFLEELHDTHYLIILHANFKYILVIRFYELLSHVIYDNIL